MGNLSPTKFYDQWPQEEGGRSRPRNSWISGNRGEPGIKKDGERRRRKEGEDRLGRFISYNIFLPIGT
jgi:hypothetical protein